MKAHQDVERTNMSLADMESTTFNVEARQHTVSSDIDRINKAMACELDLQTE
jgi:hypothetical protein